MSNSKTYHYGLKENFRAKCLNNVAASKGINDGRKRQKLEHVMHSSSSSNAFRKVNENAKVKFIPPEEVASTFRGSACCKSSTSGASRHQSNHANVTCPVNSRKALTNGYRIRTLSTIGVPNQQTKSIVSPAAALSIEKAIVSKVTASDVKETRTQKNKISEETSNAHFEDKHKATSIVAKESYPQQEHNQRKATTADDVGVEHMRDKKVRTGETLGGVEWRASLCNISASKEKTLPFTLKINPNENLLNFPSAEPCWRGDFEIFDMVNHGYDEIQAHFPSQVSRKVYEISKKLPERLKLSMVPRKTSWSKKFQSNPPTHEDVGIRFFPGQFERQRDKYFRLLKRIDSRDSCLKAWIGDVQLLIYSSNQLTDCQHIDGQNYLWGVFLHLKHWKEVRHRQELICSTATAELKSNACAQAIVNFEVYDQEEVDMEVDMIGGKEIVEKTQSTPEIHDSALNRKTSSTHSDLPLGYCRAPDTNLACLSPTVDKTQLDPKICDSLLCRKSNSIHSDVRPGFSNSSNTKQARVLLNADKIKLVPEIHDCPLRSSISKKWAVILPLFPQEAESIKVKETSNNSTRQTVSVDLSLSRPDYLMNGNVYVSGVSFNQGGCDEEDLQLKL